MTLRIITWDLGATKCTAGIIDYNPFNNNMVCTKYFTIKLAAVSSLEHLINQLETSLNFKMTNADAICIGAAGYYNGSELLHTNPYPYLMNFADIAKSQDWPAFAIIHDYAAVVCATFTSYLQQPANIKRLNTCPTQTYGRRVALGIGTGLGLKDGILLPNGDFWLGTNEAGHIGITHPPHAEKHYLVRHQAIMQFLHEKNIKTNNSPITFEALLTGKGLVNLYQFFHPQVNKITPEEVGDQMAAGKEGDLLDAFAWYLGLFIGSVQLIFMPESGIWIAGGIIMNHLPIFDRPDFFAGIQATPAYLSQREAYPLGILCNPEHPLIGCGYYAVNKLLSLNDFKKARTA